MSGVIKILSGLNQVSFKGINAYATGRIGSPGVIVVQEWWGVTDEIQAQALLIASKGYRAIIPDLYKGKLGVDAEEASHLMNHLDFATAVTEIGDTANFLKEEGSTKVGIVGFCMGGALTLASVAKYNDLFACAAPFYGTPAGADFSNVTIPVEAHFGVNDNMAGFSDIKTAESLPEKFQHNPNFKLHLYPGVGHAFLNGQMPGWIEKKKDLGFGEHNQEQVDTAFSNLFQLFEKHLSN